MKLCGRTGVEVEGAPRELWGRVRWERGSPWKGEAVKGRVSSVDLLGGRNYSSQWQQGECRVIPKDQSRSGGVAGVWRL